MQGFYRHKGGKMKKCSKVKLFQAVTFLQGKKMGVYQADYLPNADQVIQIDQLNATFLRETEIALRLCIKSWFTDVEFKYK